MREDAPRRSRIIIETDFAPTKLRLIQKFRATEDKTMALQSEFSNLSGKNVHLNRVQLLGPEPGAKGQVRLSRSPRFTRIYEQGNYWANVRWLGRSGAGEGSGKDGPSRHASDLCWLSFDLESRTALCVGFLTEERWRGQITTEESGGKPLSWVVGFDGGDLAVRPDERVALEEVMFLAGRDPWALLERYADAVGRRHKVKPAKSIPVSWCSWYPHRLGVTEERVLANARIGAERLKPLGLSIMELDLGWERGHLPSAFEENDQFPHGLAWLANQLEGLGFKLGAWKAPFSVSELDPLFREHPEWLLSGEGRKPLPRGEWFWEPHGKIYALDLTHPDAQRWLREKMRGLAQRGVRYLKTDFLGVATDGALRDRHDPRMVAGGGTEASRVGLRIMREEMQAADPDALLLNCSGPELPGTGSFPLLYTCNDTGNTGYVGWEHHRQNYGLNLAGHLFKHRRWGIVQPSCLCVGLPGTIEEARLRATATFMSGGQVDIGDDLTLLPEDRWEILLATLPPLGTAARPLDLFEPIGISHSKYEAMCRGRPATSKESSNQIGSRVWHLPISSSWDDWHLIALFSYEALPDAEGRPSITTFHLSLPRLGLAPGTEYWAHEFWSRQFLGEIVAKKEGVKGYVHPGDTQALILAATHSKVKISYFGPAVKLLIVRNARPHPWVVGTTFHQSGGTELSDVAWDPAGTLRGELNRPAGQQGCIIIAGASDMPGMAKVGGERVCPRPGANGSIILPVLSGGAGTTWELCWTAP